MDSSGTFHFSELINTGASNIGGLDFDRFLIKTNADHPIFFHEGKLFFVIQRGDIDRFTFPAFFRGDLIGYLSLPDRKITTLPITYPKQLTENYYGFLSDINVTFLQDRILYNFKHSPDIYVYDLLKETVAISSQSSTLQTTLEPYNGPTGSPPELIKHLNFSTEYQAVKYNSTENLYYRIAMVPGQLPGKSRNVGITFFDQDFAVIDETVLPAYHHFGGNLVVKDGLLIKYSERQKENEIQYRLFSMNGL